MLKIIYILALAYSLFISPFAYASEYAGKVLAAKGITYQDVGSHSKPLKRGNKVYARNVIRTSENSKVQIRFTDGTILTLNENTAYRINSYSYDKNNSANSKQLNSLIKGGFRTITGLIAKQNPDNHQTQTPVTTIGIRSTTYELELVKDSGLEYLILNVPKGTACVFRTERCFGPNQKYQKGIISKDKDLWFYGNTNITQEIHDVIKGESNINIRSDFKKIEQNLKRRMTPGGSIGGSRGNPGAIPPGPIPKPPAPLPPIPQPPGQPGQNDHVTNTAP